MGCEPGGRHGRLAHVGREVCAQLLEGYSDVQRRTLQPVDSAAHTSVLRTATTMPATMQSVEKAGWSIGGTCPPSSAGCSSVLIVPFPRPRLP
eukprot:scaffold315312_cov32-Tisochrysis_lutea.AAC.1